MRKLLSLTEVADKLSVSTDWFFRNRARLIADRGFPPAIENFHRNRWDNAAIDRWLELQVPAHLRQGALTGQVAGSIGIDTSDLADRGARIAAALGSKH